MRVLKLRPSLAATALAAVLLGTPILSPSNSGAAEDPAPCSCPDQSGHAAQAMANDPRPMLDENDEIAALETIQLALSELGDGASYVWHRRHGQFSGIVQPTASFKDAAGNVCRHVVLVLSTPQVSRKAEGIACRLPDGRWRLEG